jgi:hypothetical protein
MTMSEERELAMELWVALEEAGWEESDISRFRDDDNLLRNILFFLRGRATLTIEKGDTLAFDASPLQRGGSTTR